MKKIVFASATISLCLTLFFYLSNSEQKAKVTEFKSMQKGKVEINDRPRSSREDSLIGIGSNQRKITKTVSPSKKTRSIAEKVFIGNEAERYLSRKQGDYLFSEDVIAVQKNDFQNKPENVLTEIQGMLVVKKEGVEVDGLYLVKKESDSRVGLYMGKIVIIHQKDQNFESRLRSIVGDQNPISNISRVYLIESKSISESVKLIEKLKAEYPGTLMDLDINYSRAYPK